MQVNFTLLPTYDLKKQSPLHTLLTALLYLLSSALILEKYIAHFGLNRCESPVFCLLFRIHLTNCNEKNKTSNKVIMIHERYLGKEQFFYHKRLYQSVQEWIRHRPLKCPAD